MSKLITILINRSDVENQNIQPTLLQFHHFASSAELAKESFESVDVVFNGYDDDSRELWEIGEVRQFVSSLNNSYTHWIYFLNKYTSGLQAILFCLLPVKKREQGHYVDPDDISHLLNEQWWHGFNYISELSGLSKDPEREEQVGMAAVNYLISGPSLMEKSH